MSLRPRTAAVTGGIIVVLLFAIAFVSLNRVDDSAALLSERNQSSPSTPTTSSSPEGEEPPAVTDAPPDGSAVGDSAAIPVSGEVNAAVETDPVPNGGDAADDIALWVNPENPEDSLIIGTDKLGGLAVYGLDGRELQYYTDGRFNNVDLRQGFPLGGRQVALVAASETEKDVIRLYQIDPESKGLTVVGPAPIETELGVAGLCMYRSVATGAFSVFVTDSSGTIQQLQLSVNGTDVTGKRVRTIQLDTTVEGCVADDTNGYLYLAEEGRGIWRFPAEPDSSDAAMLIDEVIDGGSPLVADIEGLTIFDAGGGSGYLIASSQGSDTFVVYDRQIPNEHLATFEIAPGSIDGVTHTDGIDVTSASLGGPFDSGLFIAQDDMNDAGNQNFKLVPWSSIADLLDTGVAEAQAPAPDLDPVGESADAATDLFVSSTNGDDANSGRSASQPFRTLDKAARAVVPGQTIHLERGSRWSETLKLSVTGTPSQPVRVVPHGSGAAPIIENQLTCVLVAGTNITVEGLTIQNCTWSGFTISGDSNVVTGNRITGNAAGVYVRSGANGNAVRFNAIVDNNVMSVLTEGGSDDSGAFGILVHGDNTDIGYNTISGSNAFSYDYGWDGAAVEIYGGRNNYIHHNYASDNDAFVELGEARSSGNTIAYNQVTSDLETSVFIVTRGKDTARGPVTGTIVDNNSVYMTGSSSQGFVCHAGCTTDILTLRNNVIEAGWRVGYADGPFNGDTNIYFRGALEFVVGPNSIVADPLWRDPDSGDLRLLAGSPAIDRGLLLDYAFDIDGSAAPIDGDNDGLAVPDVGAHESTSSSIAPAGWPLATAPP